MSEQEQEHIHGPAYPNKPKKVQYYAPNELVFYVEHTSAPSEPLTNDWLLEALPDEGDIYRLSDEITHTLKKVLPVTFPASGDKPGGFTLFCLRSDALDSVDEFLNFYRYDSERQGIQLKDGKGVLRYVMFNWFNGAAYHWGTGSHGPGGPPCPVEDPDIIVGLGFEFDPQKLASDRGLHFETAAPPGNVVVYILDTIPEKCRIQKALSTWPLLGQHYTNILAHKSAKHATNADIYETEKATYYYGEALQPQQDFGPTYFSLEPPPPHPYALGNHEYDSSDHGLFIAGIVHKFVPEVEMHVIQVMNDFGVGTFTNFANGFRYMVKLHEELYRDKDVEGLHFTHHAIVNCSFTLSIPIGDHKEPVDEGLAACEKAHPGLFKQQIEYLIAAYTAALATDAIIVAAAGNDSLRDKSSPKEPRYPAKYRSIIGVGALKGDDTAANYSNKNDAPPSEGVYVFGGDYVNGVAGAVSSKNKMAVKSDEGIISIFTGNLNIEISGSGKVALHPDIFDNPTGYAEWKGTSFATPVLAGTIAHLCWLWGKSPNDMYNIVIKNSVGADRFFKKVKQKHS